MKDWDLEGTRLPVKLEMDSFALNYIRSFKLAGRSARIDVGGAYQKGRWEGLLEGAPASRPVPSS